MFQGGIQALSRSYFAKIIPPEKSGEFFGIFDICGKGASFVGTALVGLLTQLTRSPSSGVGALAVLFAAGFILLEKREGGREHEAGRVDSADGDDGEAEGYDAPFLDQGEAGRKALRTIPFIWRPWPILSRTVSRKRI